MDKRKLILYIATSLDGYIAAPDDDLGFLSLVAQEGEDYGYSVFIKEIDTVIMGRKTYDWVIKQVKEFPHADKQTFIISTQAHANTGNITFYKGNLKELVLKLKFEKGKHIFCDGGAQLVNALLKECLIDEFIISIIPVLLGGGIRLFNEDFPIQKLELIESKSYKSGLVQLHYGYNMV
jgi:dihydrofolate reductase